MEKQKTKEEFSRDLILATEANKQWVERDLDRRKEFARAFGWNKQQRQYDYQKELYEPTWIEIFVEVGKLLSARDFRDFEGNLSEVEYKISDLEKRLAPTNPN